MEVSKGYLRSFYATGHAQQGNKGHDIVCAAFTFLVRTIWRYYIHQDYLIDSCVEQNILSFKLKDNMSCVYDMTQLLLLGLNDLESEYPHAIHIHQEES